MLFNFRLTPTEDIAPFESSGNQHLHWFGLTDGCYWLRAGDAELFCYAEQFLAAQAHSDPCKPYVDYYVVRLWEDLLDILPDVLAPVPDTLAEKLASENLLDWRTRVERWMETRDDSIWNPAYGHAGEWLHKRVLSTGYLLAGPVIWFWNDGTHIHIEWDNRRQQIEGQPVWAAQVGGWLLSIEEFLDEVRAFDSGFIQAMNLRVDQIATGWTRPEVYLDQDELAREHADRSTWLKQALGKTQQAQATDWAAIIKAVARIESET
jgi:hypothetical protein